METKGVICLDDELGISYRISTITFTEWEDGTFEYRFEPCYAAISLLDSRLYQGIPGLDMDVRKPVYVRRNMTPVFIEERTPGPHREDLDELLEACGMDYLNRLEWLIRTDLRYSGDRFYVRRFTPEDEIREVEFPSDPSPRAAVAARWVVEQLAQGRTIRSSRFTIDDTNRQTVFHVIRELYARDKMFRCDRQRRGIEKARAAGKYAGRKPIVVDIVKFDRVGRQYLNGELSAQDAADLLGVSVSTFRRRMKQFFPGERPHRE